MNPKVAIVYLLWSNEPQKYMVAAIDAIKKQTYGRENLGLVIIYNSHKPDEPSEENFIKGQVEMDKDYLPETTVLVQKENLGFAGGNNIGMQWAIDRGFEYVFLHNADGFLVPETIERLVAAMEADKNIGQVQPLILLHPEHGLINSAGNAWHYLGMGFCELERQPVAGQNLPQLKEIGYSSGAATMFRVSLLKKYGLWKEIFYLYHEDTEYSLRLRLLGYKIMMVSGAIFYHKYEFSRSITKLFWMERNRHALKLLFYKWPTLALLLPLEIIYNIGLLVAAWRGKWIDELLKVYDYWLRPENWKPWLAYRREIQSTRKISDRELLKYTVSKVVAGEDFVGRPMHSLANGIFTIYGFLLKLLIQW